MGCDKHEAFAVWITGLPASGKSTLAKSLKAQLAGRGINIAVLESDELRKVFTPDPRYDEKERTAFYGQITYVGALLVRHGVPVIFDATANRRVWREEARRAIPRFLEVYVDSALEVCISRDPKGIYQQAKEGAASTAPGLQTGYETPLHPDIVVHGNREEPGSAAGPVVAKLIEKGYVPSGDGQ